MMRIAALTITTLATAAISVAANAASLKVIPVEYRGNWMVELKYCNFEGDTLDQELYITAKTIGYHHETFRVKTIRRVKGKLFLTYYPLKDATRRAPPQLMLTEKQTMLNDYWNRCPAAAAP
jgi:hypothetical protein